MRRSDFTDTASGRLEPTTFLESVWKDGKRETRAVPGLAFVPSALPPHHPTGREIRTELFDQLVAVERQLAKLEVVCHPLKNPHLLIGPLSRREAKLSSAIENTFASAEQMALFEVDPAAVQHRSDVREVNNYVRALEHGLNSHLPVSLRLIREMHEVLLEGIVRPGLRPGHFRTTQNAIGKDGEPFERARFVPPPPEAVMECLSALEKFIHAPTDLPRIAHLALVHYQFEAIHPFDDGNGRLGRLLIVLLLCDKAAMPKPFVYVSGYFEQHRQRYYDLLLRVSTHGEWMPWIQFFVEAVAMQSEDANTRAIRLIELREKHHLLVREKRASALLPQLVDQLFVRPSLTISEVSRLTGVGAGPAGKAVDRLVSKGILREATGRKKDRIFVAPEILDIIEN